MRHADDQIGKQYKKDQCTKGQLCGLVEKTKNEDRNHSSKHATVSPLIKLKQLVPKPKIEQQTDRSRSQ
jgi:hypothetical protein